MKSVEARRRRVLEQGFLLRGLAIIGEEEVWFDWICFDLFE